MLSPFKAIAERIAEMIVHHKISCLLLLFQLLGASAFTSSLISSNRGNGARSSSTLELDGKGMAGGTQHIVGDVLRALQPSYLKQVAKAIDGRKKGAATIDTSNMVDNAPSWDELSSRLTMAQSPAEKNFRTNLENGTGPPSAAATLRLFDGDNEPKVVLYRDSAGWCPYCAKVWMALEERRVSYQVKKIDMRCYGAGKPEEFLKLSPNGNLPVVVIDGMAYSESDVIMDLIDEMGSLKTPALRPQEGTDAAERLKYLCDDDRNSLERRLYTRWMYLLTGVRKPEEYRLLYEEHLDEVEEELAAAPAGGPYFLGKDLSLVDIKFIPFVERQMASLAYFKGVDYRAERQRRPNLIRWLEAMESRPSYQATKSDWYTHSRALPPQLSADCSPGKGQEVSEMQALIDDLPEGPSDDVDSTSAGDDIWIEPGWDWCSGDMAAARREAAERIISNHENIVKFASRAAGTPGLPASAAPLAGPRDKPNEDAEPAVDLMLRHTVDALLSSGRGGGMFGSLLQGSTSTLKNGDAVNASIRSLSSGKFGRAETTQAVADCVDYLRERIGVPRDMSHPAAQALRAELKLVSGSLRQGASAVSSDAPVNEAAAV